MVDWRLVCKLDWSWCWGEFGFNCSVFICLSKCYFSSYWVRKFGGGGGDGVGSSEIVFLFFCGGVCIVKLRCECR